MGLSCRHGECYQVWGPPNRKFRMQTAFWFSRCLSGVWVEEPARPMCSGTLECLPRRKTLLKECVGQDQSPLPRIMWKWDRAGAETPQHRREGVLI